MADYWKSQPRHFCDFCKCWTADNKPSRDFHERGKRHQENVKKKLDGLRKKGLADAKQEKETSSYLKQMEKAALKKLKEDLTQNPTMASQYGVVLKPKKVEAKSVEESQLVGEWCEATTNEGYTYYWNTVTKETQWELPEVCSQPTKEKSSDKLEETSMRPPTKETDVIPLVKETNMAPLDRETDMTPPAKRKKKMRKDAQQSADNKSTSSALPENVDDIVSCDSTEAETSCKSVVIATCQPRLQHHSAYGQWHKVQEEGAEDQVDLQLPVDASKATVETVIVTNEPKIKFPEKKVTSLASVPGTSASGQMAPVGFRKPKTGINRSIRTTDCSEES